METVAGAQYVSFAKLSRPSYNSAASSSLSPSFFQFKASLVANQRLRGLNLKCIKIKQCPLRKNFGVVHASDSGSAAVSQGWLLEPVGDGDWKHIGTRVSMPGAFEIFSSEMLVGRVPEEADLVIPIATVSAVHARIQNKEGSLSVTDLDSTNGTFINEKRVPPGATAAVPPGSLLTFGCLNPEKFKKFKLVKRIQLSHNVAKFRFALPTPTSVLGLPIGQHISCRGKDANGEDVIKPYTPTTLDSDLGYFELVIKMYPQGRMSHHFREMHEGDYLDVKGPKGRFKYEPGQVRAFGMLAGGTGITPMFQVAKAILENPIDATRIRLIYANVKYEDILLKEELDSFARDFPDRFSIYYVLNESPEEWTGGVGFVSKEMIQAHCPEPASDIQILRCGPPPMNKAMAAHLEALGYTSAMQFQF